MMRASICCCLFAFFLRCNITAGKNISEFHPDNPAAVFYISVLTVCLYVDLNMKYIRLQTHLGIFEIFDWKRKSIKLRDVFRVKAEFGFNFGITVVLKASSRQSRSQCRDIYTVYIMYMCLCCVFCRNQTWNNQKQGVRHPALSSLCGG